MCEFAAEVRVGRLEVRVGRGSGEGWEGLR
jgi:hypothetical protein